MIDDLSHKLRYRQWVVILTGIMLHLALSGAVTADTLISPDDPSINYYGRFDFSDPKAPRFNWSGSTIEFRISGSTSVGMEFTDGAGYYDVEIDGALQPSPVYADSWDSKKYVLISTITPVSHIIRIIRRNEPYWAIATFSGIYLSTGGKMEPQPKPTRKMEFCGDSWTAGYFVEDCTDQQSKTNTNKSWARLTSKAFRAQDIILAESGIGLVKSLGGKTPLPGKYLCTFDTMGGAPSPMWNFSSWIPDIVTVFLGINDKSSNVTDNEYIAAAHAFISTIRGNYPETPILFIAQTWMMDAATKAAVATETTALNHKNIYFLECNIKVSGCSAHPTAAENKKIADTVVAAIEKITGWDTMGGSTGNIYDRPPAAPSVRFKAIRIGNSIRIAVEPELLRQTITVFSADGRRVKQLQPGLSGACLWNTTTTMRGIYILGGTETGWMKMAIN